MTYEKDYIIVNAKLPTNLIKRFRRTIFNKYGLTKGDTRKCLIEALELWIENNKEIKNYDI